LGPSQKTLRPTWCPELVTGLRTTFICQMPWSNVTGSGMLHAVTNAYFCCKPHNGPLHDEQIVSTKVNGLCPPAIILIENPFVVKIRIFAHYPSLSRDAVTKALECALEKHFTFLCFLRCFDGPKRPVKFFQRSLKIQ